jgi:uncharacterized protein
VRLLAVADLHGRPDRWAALRRAVDTRSPHGLVVAGDLAPRRALVRALETINALGPPVFLVRGNSEGRGFEGRLAALPNLTLLTERPKPWGPVSISGLGGALLLPLASRICWREAAQLATLTPGPRPNILVVHPPPRGSLDTVLGGLHAGSRGLARWIDRHQPDLVVCGHIHEGAGVARLGRTTVVNCAVGAASGGALIEVHQGNLRVEMLPPVEGP